MGHGILYMVTDSLVGQKRRCVYLPISLVRVVGIAWIDNSESDRISIGSESPIIRQLNPGAPDAAVEMIITAHCKTQAHRTVPNDLALVEPYIQKSLS
jgi:hypothetical protein